MIRELSSVEFEQVSGGLQPPSIHPLMSARLAMFSFPGLGMVAASATTGWNIGQWLNKNTAIQEVIRDFLEATIERSDARKLEEAERRANSGGGGSFSGGSYVGGAGGGRSSRPRNKPNITIEDL